MVYNYSHGLVISSVGLQVGLVTMMCVVHDSLEGIGRLDWACFLVATWGLWERQEVPTVWSHILSVVSSIISE